MRKAQISLEYLIVVAFVTFIVITTLGISLTYSAQIQDAFAFNQIERFARKLIATSESVHFAGPPAKTKILLYLPSSVNSVNITSDSIVFKVTSSTGENTIAYSSKVQLSGEIEASSGLKRILIAAQTESVEISQI